MKKPIATVTLAVAAGLCAATTPATELTGNVALVSDYVWRGVSQTLGGPALQGGFDLDYGGGWYAGVWASNVDFFDERAPDADIEADDGAHLELDYTAGFATEQKDGANLDIGVARYTYPGANRDLLDSLTEAYVGLSYEGWTTRITRDYDNNTLYSELDLDFAMGKGVTFTLGAGKFVDHDFNYVDYRATLATEAGGFRTALSFSTTSMNEQECIDFAGYDDLCDARTVLSFSKEL